MYITYPTWTYVCYKYVSVIYDDMMGNSVGIKNLPSL